jgi:hypothetical protein
MKHNAEILVDEAGIEILVGYDYELTMAWMAEEGNPGTLVEPAIYTELTSVEVVIKGVGVDILDRLNDNQKMHLITQLTYE